MTNITYLKSLLQEKYTLTKTLYAKHIFIRYGQHSQILTSMRSTCELFVTEKHPMYINISALAHTGPSSQSRLPWLTEYLQFGPLQHHVQLKPISTWRDSLCNITMWSRLSNAANKSWSNKWQRSCYLLHVGCHSVYGQGPSRRCDNNENRTNTNTINHMTNLMY